MIKNFFFRYISPQTGWVMICCLVISGCWGCAFRDISSSLPEDLPPINGYTKILLSETMEKNQDILTAKGKGWLTIKSRKLASRFRIIWAARMPHDLRITLLDSGHPVETLIANETRIHFFSHTGAHKPHTGSIQSKELRYFFPVNIPMEHIVRLFLGKIPIYDMPPTRSFLPEYGMEYSTAIITENLKKDPGPQYAYAQDLEQQLVWDTRADISRIRISRTAGILKKTNTFLYQIDFGQWFAAGRYRFPGLVEISNSKEENLTISITELQPNIPVAPSIFEIPQ